MTNTNTQNSCEELCPVCTSYDDLTKLLAVGLTLEEALDAVVSGVIEFVLEDSQGNQEDVTTIYKEGYEDGYVSAMEDVRDQVGAVVEKITGTEETCDCDGCCVGE